MLPNTRKYGKLYLHKIFHQNKQIITSIHPNTQAYEFGSNYIIGINTLLVPTFWLFSILVPTF